MGFSGGSTWCRQEKGEIKYKEISWIANVSSEWEWAWDFAK